MDNNFKIIVNCSYSVATIMNSKYNTVQFVGNLDKRILLVKMLL